MKMLIMAVDMVFSFQIAVFETAGASAGAWYLNVLTVADVSDVLLKLGCITSAVAAQLSSTSKTITPQAGIKTIPLSTFAALGEMFNPEEEPPSPEAQDAFMLVAEAEATEEQLIGLGFMLKPNERVQ